ncbi:MAG: MFS transporter [Alphaproteobacteria bacterium]
MTEPALPRPFRLPRERLALVALFGAAGMAFLAPSTVAPALPAIAAQFAHVPDAVLWTQFILTMPMLCMALVAPLTGWVVDRLGRRPVLLLATTGFGLAGLAGLVVDTIAGFLVSRAVLGICLSGVMTASTALIGDYWKGEARARVVSLQAACMSFGTLAFVGLAGELTLLHWRGGFLLYGYALLLLPIMLASLPEPPRHRAGDAVPAGDPVRVPWLLVGVLCALALGSMIIFFMTPSKTAFLIIELGAGDAASAGWAIGVFNLSAGLASLTYKRLLARLGWQGTFAAAYLVIAIGYSLVGQADDYAGVIAGMAIAGTALGWLLPNLNFTLISAVPAGTRGRAIGAMTASLYLGQVVSPLVVGPVADVAGGVGGAFRVAGVVLLACAVAFALVAVARRRR